MKLTPIAASIIPLFFCSLAFGYIAKSTQPELFYCPQKIECAEDENIKSCKATGGNPEYFGKLTGYNKKGTYTLYKATGSEDQIATADYTPCHYSSLISDRDISAYSKDGASYRAFFGENTNWTIQLRNGVCHTKDPFLCPFAVNRILFIYAVTHRPDDSIGFRATSIEVEVNGITWNYGHIYKEVYISRATALDVCGSVKECTFNIKTILVNKSWDTIEVIGKVTVNVEDMKILKIEQKPDPYREIPYLKMVKDEQFNIIKFI